jgi:ribose 5-phosphate isomerase A
MSKELKMAAARAALGYVRDKMIVGLGTGSTAECFIDLLIENKKNFDIKVVPSSKKTELLAKNGNLSVTDINEVEKIDIMVDGADEVDDLKRMIKGGGGALFREKILAKAAKRMIVIIDKSKCVEQLGKKEIPVEVISFGHKFTQREIQNKGFRCQLRLNSDHSPYITDNNNYIYDVSLDSFISDPEHIHNRLISITGVLETGLFFGLNSTIIIASSSKDVIIED